jgi:CspA family cold shock protein
MAEGTIKKLTDKGFGFINTGKDKDLFFHSKSLQGVSFEQLQEGERVSYTEGRSDKGPCAENVQVKWTPEAGQVAGQR